MPTAPCASAAAYLAEHNVGTILKSALAAVVEEQPDDPIAALSEALLRLGRERLSAAGPLRVAPMAGVSDRQLHAAPMAGVSDRHHRMLLRCVSPRVVTWSEMTWDRTILDAEAAGTLEKVIGFSAEEHPVVLQLGGSEPASLARAAALGAARGYDEINLNCGCPAGTGGLQRECYGARLMLHPERVAACCSAMREAVGDALPISVKCRLGVDGRESYANLSDFVRIVSTTSGVRHFIVHARHAKLDLNANRNLSVPPLNYKWVACLRTDFPGLFFTLNGGISDEAEAGEWLASGMHAVMLGRRSVADPFLFARFDGENGAGRSRREVLRLYGAYAAVAQAANWGGGHPETLVRKLLQPLSGLFLDTVSGPKWRQALSQVVRERETLRCVPVERIISRCLDECGSDASGLMDELPGMGVAAKRKARERARDRERDAAAGGDVTLR